MGTPTPLPQLSQQPLELQNRNYSTIPETSTTMSPLQYQQFDQQQQHKQYYHIQQQPQQFPSQQSNINNDIDDICIISPDVSPIKKHTNEISISSTDINIYPMGLQTQLNESSQLQSTDNYIISNSIPSSSSSTTTATPTPRVPISHLLANNQYPSLTNVPINIAQSYAPIFVQPQNQQSEIDIYNDYVKNPYNLTLQTEPSLMPTTDQEKHPQPQQQQPQQDDNVLTPTQPQTSNVFQSVNYFGTDSGVIPPGSEMLFSRP